ncbi:MAG: hypothetical protein JW704_03505 [Anaerolineaceae bacterium]|nr:hypothetical protein [Anaerolineaceae bacterium]
MAKKRRKTKPKTIVRYRQSKPTVKYRYRTKVKKVRSKPKNTLLGGINVSGALKDMMPLMCGALLAKFAAKKFAEGGAETENWTWKNYGWGLVGTAVAAVGTSAMFRRSRTAQKIFEGGLLLLAYKIFTNEIAPKSDYLNTWFGADEDIYPDMSYGFGADSPYPDMSYGAEDLDGEPGDLWRGDETTYAMGADRAWRPVDEMHREIPDAPTTQGYGYGVDIEPADPAFGVDFEPADPAFGVDFEPADPAFGSLESVYKKMYS